MDFDLQPLPTDDEIKIVRRALIAMVSRMGERGKVAETAMHEIVAQSGNDAIKLGMLVRFYAVMWRGFLDEVTAEFAEWQRRG
jgi:hypothetical protein